MSPVAQENLIDVDALIPDGIEPIELIRTWRFNSSLGLQSVNTGYYIWPAGEALKAECEYRSQWREWRMKRGEGRTLDELRNDATARAAAAMPQATAATISTYWFGSSDAYTPSLPNVEAPAGYGYVLENIPHDCPDEACSCGIYAGDDISQCPSADVWGKVKMWGKVVPGAKGARAQYAYPSELHVPAHIADDPKILAYGVPVIVDDAVDQIVQAVRRRRLTVRQALFGAVGLNLAAGAFNLLNGFKVI